MTGFAVGFSSAGPVQKSADELALAVEEELGGVGQIVGGLLLASAGVGPRASEVGEALLARWPAAHVMGTSFEGVIADGRVYRDEPGLVLLAWNALGREPVPFVLPPDLFAADADRGHRIAQAVIDEAGGPLSGDDDLLLLFPDALESGDVESWLSEALPLMGRPALAGAAASGVGGRECLAWLPGEMSPGATMGLVIRGFGREGVGDGDRLRVAMAGGSRLASPWLEISKCQGRWVTGLEDEPPAVWLRRQLGLDDDSSLEPFLDRILVRHREVGCIQGDSEGNPGKPPDYSEQFVIGLDEKTGAISLPMTCRRGDFLALALPDAGRARDCLRKGMRALEPAPLVLQFACRARDVSLHGDEDVESALVASEMRPGKAIGTVAPFQLGPSSKDRQRLLVYATVFAVLGESQPDSI